MENLDFLFILDQPKSRKRIRSEDPYVELQCDIVTRFDFNSALICQLNNCTARKLHLYSFSWDLARKYKYANPYQHRVSGPYPNLAAVKHRPKLGSVQILQPPPGTKGPSFACLYGQYKMGKWNSKFYLNCPRVDRSYKYKALHMDTYQHRLQYSKKCLHNLLNSLNNKFYQVIVFPSHIGCGLSQGNWEDYEPLIVDFCHKLKCQSPHTRVCIASKY